MNHLTIVFTHRGWNKSVDALMDDSNIHTETELQLSTRLETFVCICVQANLVLSRKIEPIFIGTLIDMEQSLLSKHIGCNQKLRGYDKHVNANIPNRIIPIYMLLPLDVKWHPQLVKHDWSILTLLEEVYSRLSWGIEVIWNLYHFLVFLESYCTIMPLQMFKMHWMCSLFSKWKGQSHNILVLATWDNFWADIISRTHTG